MTITFQNASLKEYGLVKVRFSPHFAEVIEFEVELSPIPVDDFQGKDVTVNWKFFNGFDAQGQFWTDSNGLEMQKRQITLVEGNLTQMNNQSGWKPNYWTISNNYYPVDSAIVMRDMGNLSNIQVTLMNERAQGGSADLTDQATIELMQNRRVLFDDDLGIEEALNETDTDGAGLRVNALYYLHIFDMQKGASLQRQQQLRIQQRPEYFFAFDFSTDVSLSERGAPVNSTTALSSALGI